MLNPQSLLRFMPFLSWTGELRDKNVLSADILAGITVALVLIPQSMAYAQLAGLPAYYGLYAAFLPPVVAALFGSSRQLATGPVAVVSLLTAATLEPLATKGSTGYIMYAITLTLMIGVFQLSLGLLRLGVLVNFLAHPVVIGFTNAAAIIIATSQLDKIFGVRAVKAEHHYETVWNTVTAAVDYIHWPTLAMAVLAFSIIIYLRRVSKKLPGVLIAVAVTSLLSWMIDFEKKQTASTDQIVSAPARGLIANEAQARLKANSARQDFSQAQNRYNDVVARHGVEHAASQSALSSLNTLIAHKDRLERSAQSLIDGLQALRFEYVAGSADGPGRFYLKDQVPSGLDSTGGLWRVSTIDDAGTLHMSGGGRVVGAIPRGLPAFDMPTLDFSVIMELLSAAVTISLIGFVEAISIAKAMATRTRQRLNANQELIGQGLGNIVGSFFQSYPTSGSFSRSAVNIGAGAITGFSSIVTGFIVVITLLWLTPLLYHLPEATLAAVIMMAVFGLINITALKHIWHAHKHDGMVALTSMALTLAFAPHLDNGILMGAGLALVLYLYRTMRPKVAILARHHDGTLREAERFGLQSCQNIAMVRFDGSLFFANTSYFEDQVLERVAAMPNLQYVIVVGDGMNEIDATGAEMLLELAERLHKSGIAMLFTGLKKQVLDVLGRAGLSDNLGQDKFFRTEEHALEYLWEKLGDEHAASCPLNIVCPVEALPDPEKKLA